MAVMAMSSFAFEPPADIAAYSCRLFLAIVSANRAFLRDFHTDKSAVVIDRLFVIGNPLFDAGGADAPGAGAALSSPTTC